MGTVDVVFSSCKVLPIATYLSSMATYTHMDTHMDQTIFKSGRGGKFFLCLTFLCTSLVLVGLSAFLYSRQLETESDDLAWTTLFSHPDQLTLTKSNLLTTLPVLPRQWKVDFMFMPTLVTNTADYKSILHLTDKEEKNTASYGGRVSALWLHDNGALHIECAQNNTGTFWDFSVPNPPVGKWTQITITQEILSGKSWYSVFIDGVERYKTRNAQDREFSDVRVFASNPWHSAQPGYIKNLSIKEKV